MADAMDLVQQRVEEERERHINKARSRQAVPSRFLCESCSAPIPQERRALVVGVTTCVTCQQVLELKIKHYKGAL
ncbi:TraR/DksA family transcriptional regulator [Cronobacter malonaticus]|nr:TraR/DksA family transcriptional regulator [Cronobacter malonaticus]